ncbi:MAG: chitinase [Bacteroidetes bacterium]|nr:chitinase [Bacteroidota bacterium]
MIKRSLILCLLSILLFPAWGQQHDLIGYWQNWNSVNAPYIPLSEIDPAYTIIDVAFALPEAGTTYEMYFTPDATDMGSFIDEVQQLQGDGKKVLISIGGATGFVELQDSFQKDTFVNSMLDILLSYGFDGMDIDLEGGSMSITGGTITNPVDQKVILMIEAVQEIMTAYQLAMGKRMMLTMAPETAYAQGGQSSYGGLWGAYLPLIDALRDSIEILHVQLYNSGSMYGIDGGIYYQGTPDFIVSQTEAILQGFETDGGFFAPLQPEQVAVGLPACQNAAGGGFADLADVADAIQYLRTGIGQPGDYASFGAYPNLRGMMTWSVNWDALPDCGGIGTYADTYLQLFSEQPVSVASWPEKPPLFSISPNPLARNNPLHVHSIRDLTAIRIYDQLGRIRWNYDYNDRDLAINGINVPLERGLYVITGYDSRGNSHSIRLLVE